MLFGSAFEVGMGSLAHHGRVGCPFEERELPPLQRPDPARPPTCLRFGLEPGSAGPLEAHVGEEQLLPIAVRSGKIDSPAGFLKGARLLDAKPARLLFADACVPAAVFAEVADVA